MTLQECHQEYSRLHQSNSEGLFPTMVGHVRVDEQENTGLFASISLISSTPPTHKRPHTRTHRHTHTRTMTNTHTRWATQHTSLCFRCLLCAVGELTLLLTACAGVLLAGGLVAEGGGGGETLG